MEIKKITIYLHLPISSTPFLSIGSAQSMIYYTRDIPSSNWKKKITSDKLVVLKEEAAQIKQRQTILLGYDLTELGLDQLKQLEQQLDEGLLYLRERKEQILMYDIELARMKEKQIVLENEQLQKEIEELQSFLQTSVQPLPCFLEYSQGAKSFQDTHGTTGHDTIYPHFQEMQIMHENKNVQNQLEELQSYMPPVVRPVPRFLEYS